MTLADGHVAWLVVRYEEARAALSDRRFSKDMHAALEAGTGVVAEGLPGPALARHMLAVDYSSGNNQICIAWCVSQS